MTILTRIKTSLPAALMWITPLLLIVPNIALSITEQYTLMARLVNVVLPLGIFYLIMSSSTKVGRTVLLCLPLLVYAAFQIVLLYLYGESIIAVDMFLNVVTTNVSEATELLGNLLLAVTVIILLYIPPIALSIIFIVKKKRVERQSLRAPRGIGIALTALGAVMLAVCYIMPGHYRALRQLFPANVMANTVEAVKRTIATNSYPTNCADFKYNAVSTRDSSICEIYVMVIGETSRSDNWQLMGYDRQTNPRLAKRDDISFFTKALSESNTTHKSVPMILTALHGQNFGDSINHTKSIVTAFKEAGYATAFLSNQKPNRSYIDYFGDEADTHRLTAASSADGICYDDALMPLLRDFLDKESGAKKIFVVLHTYGSHFNYRERYPADYSRFKPDDATDADKYNREKLINAYDNSILYTDYFINQLIEELDSRNCLTAMVYLADHGEDIFDDSRERFLHASPTPTYYQLHVPMLVWMSADFREAYPDKYLNAQRLREANISSSKSAFHTLLDLAGISTPYFEPTKSLVGSSYVEPHRYYLNDHNERVLLTESGLRDLDYQKLDQKEISYK